MRPLWLLRLSMLMLTLFLLGHGLGSMNTTMRDAREASVFETMQAYTFDIMGVTRSHWDFYQGLNHYLTAALLSFIAMHLVALRLATQAPTEARALVWALALSQALFAALSWTYFFPAPAVMTTVAALSLSVAAVKLR